MEEDGITSGQSTAGWIRRALRSGKPWIQGCTIVARNYLAQADVLARSFKRHHPECPFTILIIDDSENRGGRDDKVEILSLADIDLAPGDEARMPVIYDVTELSTAVKPWLLRRLLNKESDTVVYFDPDIEIFSPLYELAGLAREYSIVLTPHVTEPIPRDERRLNESDILGSGIFNLGFIALGPGSEEFLAWWSTRLRRECVIDPARMRFTDQRWIDFVPGLFRHYILRDPGFNVAYWNLHGRTVVREGDHYLVNGKPLRFFHFSGYHPDFPHILSKHQGAQPRILLSEQPAVRRICKEYRKQLVAAGFGVANRSPYGFEFLSQGLRLDARLRYIYRQALKESERGEKAEPPSPFAPAGEAPFLKWLNQPMDAGAPGVTRLMLAIHGEREDLRKAFPQPLGADARAYYAWFLRDGHVQEKIHPSLVPGADPAKGWDHEDPPPEVQQSDAHLVNVAGYFRAELGIGEAARLLLLGLRAADVPYRTVSHDETINRQSHSFQDEPGEETRADINIICVNADQTPAFGEKMGKAFYSERYTVGVWFWEIEDFPDDFRAAFDYVDEVWVATDFIYRALLKVSPKPVFKFHLPLVRPPLEANSEVTSGESAHPFTFLFSFDFMSVLERKNPIGAITAFKQAFQPGEGPTLLIKTINGDKKLLELERVKLAAINRPDIVISDGYISSVEKDELMARCDCYVSLHRSEGYGLTIAEAMSLDKPVIATAYSGNMEFMTADNSYLCPYEYAAIGYGSAPYPPTSHWAQPNLDEAAKLMRHIFCNQEEARARGARAGEDIRTFHSPSVAGGAIKDRLIAIRARRARYGKAIPMDIVEQRLEALEAAPRATHRIFEDEKARLREVEDGIRELAAQLQNQDRATVEQRDALLEEAKRLQDLATVQADIRSGLERRLDALERVANIAEENRLRGQVTDEQLERVRTLARTLQDRDLPDVRKVLEMVSSRLDQITSHIEAAPYMANPKLLITESDGHKTFGFRGLHNQSGNNLDTYVSFEGIFRGSEEMIRDRQRVYLDLLREHAPVFDLGCGRGEMLDLLRDSDVSAVGVDLDPGMVAHARSKGHKVAQENALLYLKKQPDKSIGAIFCAQVIEHLSYEDLLAILTLGRVKLKPQGLLLLETVNPHSHRALKTFWVDLTHNKPIFPEVLVALCREAGYEEAIVRFPGGKGDFEQDRLWEGEYAVIAKNSDVIAEAEIDGQSSTGKRAKRVRHRIAPSQDSSPEPLTEENRR